jgi:hypothetical protein
MRLIDDMEANGPPVALRTITYAFVQSCRAILEGSAYLVQYLVMIPSPSEPHARVPMVCRIKIITIIII